VSVRWNNRRWARRCRSPEEGDRPGSERTPRKMAVEQRHSSGLQDPTPHPGRKAQQASARSLQPLLESLSALSVTLTHPAHPLHAFEAQGRNSLKGTLKLFFRPGDGSVADRIRQNAPRSEARTKITCRHSAQHARPFQKFATRIRIGFHCARRWKAVCTSTKAKSMDSRARPQSGRQG